MFARPPLDFCAVVVLLAAGSAAVADDGLQALVSRVEDGGQVDVPAGTYKAPVTIERQVSLKGESSENCVLEVTSDQPAIRVSTSKPVTIEAMTIKWQLATSGPHSEPKSAVFTKDSPVTLRNCRVVALGNAKRCPAAVFAGGFSNVKLENCRFEGFEFTIGYGEGSKGTVAGCAVVRPGHCGISVYSDADVHIVGNVVTGSEYHGVRCTGGTLNLHNNLIVENKNRGVYLGNKSAHGRIFNNVILRNGTGISAFGQSDVLIENNVILDSHFAGLDTRDTCPITVRNNLFQGNARGIVLFQQSGTSSVTIGRNAFWNNQTNTENLEQPADAIVADPQLAAPEKGDFAIQADPLKDHEQGLSDTESLADVWKIWEQVREESPR
jgi:nitrous oxidase accessory protein NosD